MVHQPYLLVMGDQPLSTPVYQELRLTSARSNTLEEMAQHATKGLKAKAATGGRKTSGKTKKGARYVAPKSNERIQQVARQKVRSNHSHSPDNG